MKTAAKTAKIHRNELVETSFIDIFHHSIFCRFGYLEFEQILVIEIQPFDPNLIIDQINYLKEKAVKMADL